MATPPAGSNGLNVVCFGVLDFDVLLLLPPDVAVIELLASPLFWSPLSPDGVGVPLAALVVFAGEPSAGLLAGDGVWLG
jgi:hypothetical protein